MKKSLQVFSFLFIILLSFKIYSQSITWTETQPGGNTDFNWNTTSMSSDGSKMIAGAYGGRLYISINGGTNWTETQPAGDANQNWYTTSMSPDGTKIIAGVSKGRLYISTNGGTSWTETQPAGNVTTYWQTASISSDGTKIIAGVNNGGRLYISTNGGTSWTETRPAGDADQSWCTTSMSSDGNKIIAGVYNSRIYISTNCGSSWAETKPAGNVLKNWRTTSMSPNGTKIIAGAYSDRLYISTNGGTSWAETRPAGNIVKGWRTTSMSIDGTNIVAGANTDRLYVSTNGGTNWTETQPAGNANKNWYSASMNSDGSKVIAASYNVGRLYLNSGALPVELTSFSAVFINMTIQLKWETATEVNNYGFDIERKEKIGAWEKIGFINGAGNSNSPGNYIFTDKNAANGFYSYRLKSIDNDGSFTYSKEIEVTINSPKEYSLSQNFPNPFNPTTKIELSIPFDNDSEIKVYNVLGIEVATLLNEKLQAGKYSIEFNAGNLASGVYFYKATSGEYSEIKKMILLR